MTILETPRLTLRQVETEDAPFILELTRDPSYIASIRDCGLNTLDDARTFIEQNIRSSYLKNGHGLYLVCRRSDGQALGICGLLYRDALQETDIGYAFLPAWHGQGYAFEAAQACLRYGHEVLGKTRIVGFTSLDNRASVRLLEKLGLSYRHPVPFGDGREACLFD
ncbi:GNAT family N-acetyltransferase [Paludibacterium yongneupense]|uniref:GNAT family N-acetyltransferase n=1 Tax=Paludibacterium yongneupense TaxID=400061 RepID=UPI0004057FA0|nr:GNAT family N-acetyltransferase [Paludibacterium yongneupense]